MADISEKDRAVPANDALSDNKAAIHDETVHAAAGRGHAATDQ